MTTIKLCFNFFLGWHFVGLLSPPLFAFTPFLFVTSQSITMMKAIFTENQLPSEFDLLIGVSFVIINRNYHPKDKNKIEGSYDKNALYQVGPHGGRMQEVWKSLYKRNINLFA